MKPRNRRLTLTFGALATIAVASYATGYIDQNYVADNYVQSGGYTGAIGQKAIDAAIDAPSSTTMSVAIADSADPVITGADAYSYSVTLTNTGAAAATTVSVATTLDASLTYISSSGTGWSCGQSAGVVTCTAASIAVGAAPAITINVTTGGSAVAASSSVVASASNASNATASQGTTVQLVSKDATAGIYFPASSTEWSNFIARKGLAIGVPDAAWLFQDASGNPADAIGSFTLTASGTGLAYQQAVTGYSRKAITFTSGSTGAFTTTSASLPDLSAASILTMFVANVTLPASSKQLMIEGGAGTANTLLVNVTTGTLGLTAGSTTNGTENITTGVKPITMQHNRAGSVDTASSPASLISMSLNASASGKRVIFGAGSNPAMAILAAFEWHGAKAEVGDATVKALEQAMGFTITR